MTSEMATARGPLPASASSSDRSDGDVTAIPETQIQSKSDDEEGVVVVSVDHQLPTPETQT